MKKKMFFMLAAALLCGTATVSAQQAINVENGKVVKKITFDLEKVDINYEDGTSDVSVQKATIYYDQTPTGIAEVKQNGVTTDWYTLDGRRLQYTPNSKGIYVSKSGNNVRKSIKK